MTAQVEHRNHHEKATAYGTGGHTHHRRRMEQDGVAVGYWACEKVGWDPCPDEPDPFARLLVKLAERVVPVKETSEPRSVCETHPEERWKLYSVRAGWVCLDCRNERVAGRISRRATRAA